MSVVSSAADEDEAIRDYANESERTGVNVMSVDSYWAVRIHVRRTHPGSAPFGTEPFLSQGI